MLDPLLEQPQVLEQHLERLDLVVESHPQYLVRGSVAGVHVGEIRLASPASHASMKVLTWNSPPTGTGCCAAMGCVSPPKKHTAPTRSAILAARRRLALITSTSLWLQRGRSPITAQAGRPCTRDGGDLRAIHLPDAMVKSVGDEEVELIDEVALGRDTLGVAVRAA